MLISPTAVIKTQMVERGSGGKEKAEAEVVAQVTLRDNYECKKISSQMIMRAKNMFGDNDDHKQVFFIDRMFWKEIKTMCCVTKYLENDC